jgi:hypothetical protein
MAALRKASRPTKKPFSMKADFNERGGSPTVREGVNR